MTVKKRPGSAEHQYEYEQKLQFLYARRTAINSLIRSLEEYDFSRIQYTEHENRKSA